MIKRRDFFTLIGGATFAASGAARAQQPAMRVIGFLSSRSPAEAAGVVAEFRQGVAEIGFVEGQNLAIEYRWAEGHYDRLPAFAVDLVGRKVDLIAATGGALPTLAAKAASSTIPIVFVSGDPVGEGLVTSLARPGGNVTGFSLLAVELTGKRFELLSELVMEAKIFGVLVNPNLSRQTESIINEAQQAARARGLQLLVLKASDGSEITAAFSTFVQAHADALVVGADPFFDSQREQLVALAAHHAIPTIYSLRDTAMAGGLMSYGASFTAAYHAAGLYVGKILKGAKPADLPVQQPIKFDLIINLKTAKALGLTVPPTLLTRASEIIE
jgi:putative ABC transport system substrate-binding protein